MKKFAKIVAVVVFGLLFTVLIAKAVSLLTVPQGGTGAGTFTDGGILLGSGTGAITPLGAAANGQIPIGDGTTDPVLATVAGGRSITTTNGAGTISLAADSELYHSEKCFYIEDPVDTDDFKSLFHFRKAATITGMWCESDQTVNMDLQLDDGSPADIHGTDLVCDSTPADVTSLGGDTAAAAGERLDLVVTSVSDTPTWVAICFDFTYNE